MPEGNLASWPCLLAHAVRRYTMSVLPVVDADAVAITLCQYEDVNGYVFTCDECHRSWHVSADEAGSEPGWWLCPDGCNADASA